MRTTGVQIIEQRRRDYVSREAKQLFDSIVELACQKTPADRYELTVFWQERPPVLDKMIMEKAGDLFKEMCSDLTVAREDAKRLKVWLTPEGTGEEHVLFKLFWSRHPGKFVNKRTGQPAIIPGYPGPVFDGTVREWYETLVETIIDCGNQMWRDLKETPTTVYVGQDVKCILESSVLFKPNFHVSAPPDNRVGTLSNRFDIYEDESLTNVIRAVAVKDKKRVIGEVEVLDMKIL